MPLFITPYFAGEAEDSNPLRLSYHKQYYGLGEHYNAIIPVAVTGRTSVAGEDNDDIDDDDDDDDVK